MIAAGGRYVAFTSASATNFVLPDTNGTVDIFVRDLEATAVALAYGTGCRGTSPIGPQAEGIGQPFLGNATSPSASGNGFPQRVAILAMSLTPASIPYGQCNVLLGGTPSACRPSFTNHRRLRQHAAAPSRQTPPSPVSRCMRSTPCSIPTGCSSGFAALSQGLAITLN
jgi:hypothetical protein